VSRTRAEAETMGLIIKRTIAETTTTITRRLISEDMSASVVLVPQKSDLVRKAMRTGRGQTKLLDCRVD
jgi:hypothetical protein